MNKTTIVKWLVERKPTGKAIGDWQVVAHPSNYRTGLQAIAYLQEKENTGEIDG